jgi:pilus assembly protein Flp/PilA
VFLILRDFYSIFIRLFLDLLKATRNFLSGSERLWREQSTARSMRKLEKLLTDDSGATAIEYAFIAVLISVAIATAVSVVGINLNPIFNTIAAAL